MPPLRVPSSLTFAALYRQFCQENWVVPGRGDSVSLSGEPADRYTKTVGRPLFTRPQFPASKIPLDLIELASVRNREKERERETERSPDRSRRSITRWPRRSSSLVREKQFGRLKIPGEIREPKTEVARSDRKDLRVIGRVVAERNHLPLHLLAFEVGNRERESARDAV